MRASRHATPPEVALTGGGPALPFLHEARRGGAPAREHGIQPSAQRVVVAERVLDSEAHPSADQVLAEVTRALPMISRATVYNTLNLLVEKGLLRELVLTPGRVVFDPSSRRTTTSSTSGPASSTTSRGRRSRCGASRGSPASRCASTRW